jgi:hypothetical protein
MAADAPEDSEKDREEKVADLKQQIEQGEYRVDPTAVANAIMRRVRELAEARLRERADRTELIEPLAERTDRTEPQNECSYPDSSPGASVNTTPVGPSTTDPIQVKPTVFKRLMRVLTSPVFAGRQTQSS